MSLPEFITDEKFDLRRFLHGKRLVCKQMLFDSRPSEILKTYGRWDKEKRYPRCRTKHYDERIYVTAILERNESFYLICFSIPGDYCQTSVDDQYIWTCIPQWRSTAGAWWERTNHWYRVELYKETWSRDLAYTDFEKWVHDELVRRKGFTTERQMKKKSTKVCDLVNVDCLAEIENRDEPFNFGFDMMQSFFRTSRKIDLEL